MPRETPFHPRTAALCESYDWVEWAGFLSANSYELTHMREFFAIRTAVALIDVSPLYKYHISGPDSAKLLNRIVTRDVMKQKLQQVVYTVWCDENGKVLDDGTLSRLDDDLFRLTAAEPNIRWLQENAVGLDVEIADVTEDIAALSVQGPLSREVLQRLTDDIDMSTIKYFRLAHGTVAGVPATITRTGYTGDLGYEVWISPEHALHLWDSLIETGRPYKLRAVGQTAMDIARIEAGLLLIDVDYTSARKTPWDIQKSSPFDLGLDWTVKLDKENFVGRSALLVEKKRGSAWKTVGLVVDYDSLESVYHSYGLPIEVPETSWGEDVPIYANGKHIGKATSGCWSPILKNYIALARIRPEYAKPGTRIAMEVTVEAHREQAAAEVVATPFYDPERKRA